MKDRRPLNAACWLADEELGAVVHEVLRDLEIRIVSAQDEAAMVEVIDGGQVDLLVTDSPRVHIAPIARALRSKTITSHGLFLWVTDDQDEELLEEATRSGVDYALEPATLRAKLRQVLLAHRRRQWPTNNPGEIVQADGGDVWAILDAIPCPIFYKDTQGRYLGCNRSFEKFIGTTREQVSGMTVYDLSPQHLANRFFEADNELLARGGVQQYEARVRRADGVERDVIFYKALFGTETVTGLVGTLLDITERKELEAEVVRERERADNVLHNIVPTAIVDRLKNEDQIADFFPSVTVVFADIVGFTELTSGMRSGAIVNFLDRVFRCFDQLADKGGLEKIKTIGDAYMVASGLPEPRQDHAEAAAEFAIEMCNEVSVIGRDLGVDLKLRVGMNSGPVTAGIIGAKKFIYDLWGDVVNTASRMESHGIPGEIQVTPETKALLDGIYQLQPRGEIEVKGKGPMSTWLLTGRQ